MSKISIKNMDLHYGDFHALKNVNLEIEANKITAFIGPSGCGKSTLLKSINRMNDLVEGCRIDGQILLDGQDIFHDIDVNLLRKRVGMVFQKPNPFPMSIYDNVAYGPRTHGIRSKAKLDDLVEKSLRDAAIWNECKDRLKTSALGMSGGVSFCEYWLPTGMSKLLRMWKAWATVSPTFSLTGALLWKKAARTNLDGEVKSPGSPRRPVPPLNALSSIRPILLLATLPGLRLT